MCLHLQNWTEIRHLISTGSILSKLQSDLQAGKSLQEKCIISLSAKNQFSVPANELLVELIQALSSRQHNLSICLVCPFCCCFMQTRRFLEPTLPTILSTVSEILLILHIFTRCAKHAYFAYFIYIKYAILHMFGLNCIFTVSLLNLTEEERSKPENWIPVGWIPFYSNELSKRPSSGYESDSARYHRLMHDC